ncbi:MAG TPA: glycoside hydrolase family 3 N-terminal domain-containing protein [Elusimicrobiota bacterium]|jgi:beta-N-acetylhexosaminidase|nr:glycoside hydrolase family 3 N-terminal domain-containing protein [Elusimicrobiota bacterium]
MRKLRTAPAVLALLLLAPAARAAKVPRPRDLSVEELVGQTFMIAIDSDIAAAREADVRAGRLGGGMLRWDRFTGDQARAMSEKLHAWSKDSPHRIPFWVSTDHEGGPTFTQRLYGIAPFPGSMALGAAGSAELARGAAEATARELRALGISVTFAPSLDVNSNPRNPIIGLRSYGEDPALVARLGTAALEGYRDGGILAVAKHFPGHGDTSDDSHLGLPVNTKSLADLEKTELVPFRAAIKDGVQAIMPAHMVFPALGAPPGRPVTLSSAVIGGFLRGKLGYKGLIFSDSLDMGAISNVYGSSESAVLALLAGNDVLLIGKGDYPSAFAAVVAAVKEGRIPRAQLEASVGRILEAKRRLGLFGSSEPRPLGEAELARDRALAQKAADEAVTLVRNDGMLPLKLPASRTLSLVLFHTSRYAGEAARFAADVARRHPRTEVFDLPVSPSPAAVAAALTRTRTSAAVVVGTYQYGTPVTAAQTELVHGLIAGPAPVVAVSLMNPYDLAISSRARAAVCAYGMTDSALESAARLLFGELKPRGRLPVSVPGL